MSCTVCATCHLLTLPSPSTVPSPTLCLHISTVEPAVSSLFRIWPFLHLWSSLCQSTHPSTAGASTAATRIQYHPHLLLLSPPAGGVDASLPPCRVLRHVHTIPSCTEDWNRKALLPSASTTLSHKPGVSPRLLLPRLQSTCAVRGCPGLGVVFPSTALHPPSYLNSRDPLARGCCPHVFDASLS